MVKYNGITESRIMRVYVYVQCIQVIESMVNCLQSLGSSDSVYPLLDLTELCILRGLGSVVIVPADIGPEVMGGWWLAFRPSMQSTIQSPVLP